MPVYQVSYDNINTERVKEALFSLLEREIKDDTLDIDGFVKMTEELEKYKENLKQLDERAKSKKQIETVGTNLSFIKFNDKDILVTKIYSRNSVKANKQHVKDWLDYHLR